MTDEAKEKNFIRNIIDRFFRSDVSGMNSSESGVDWELANKPAADWAKEHAGETFTSDPEELRYIQKAISRYFLERWNQGQLWEELCQPKGPFSLEKAKEIARTEVTRAAVEGERGSHKQLADLGGIEMQPIWHTRNDNLCCDICAPRNQGKIGVDFEEVYPPAHPGCRCWLGHRIKED